jgi:hypothetical protein
LGSDAPNVESILDTETAILADVGFVETNPTCSANVAEFLLAWRAVNGLDLLFGAIHPHHCGSVTFPAIAVLTLHKWRHDCRHGTWTRDMYQGAIGRFVVSMRGGPFFDAMCRALLSSIALMLVYDGFALEQRPCVYDRAITDALVQWILIILPDLDVAYTVDVHFYNRQLRRAVQLAQLAQLARQQSDVGQQRSGADGSSSTGTNAVGVKVCHHNNLFVRCEAGNDGTVLTLSRLIQERIIANRNAAFDGIVAGAVHITWGMSLLTSGISLVRNARAVIIAMHKHAAGAMSGTLVDRNLDDFNYLEHHAERIKAAVMPVFAHAKSDLACVIVSFLISATDLDSARGFYGAPNLRVFRTLEAALYVGRSTESELSLASASSCTVFPDSDAAWAMTQEDLPHPVKECIRKLDVCRAKRRETVGRLTGWMGSTPGEEIEILVAAYHLTRRHLESYAPIPRKSTPSIASLS